MNSSVVLGDVDARDNVTRANAMAKEILWRPRSARWKLMV